ncbi:MSHA biogenesis protein MshQ [Vibrio metschnikovii]|nr:MSHA biogenesis protein MshQ [Vibrio metschnikovii]EKO3688600.1 MSHA biogenesis protein MshQ [Vibrio metschnikovii]EKO3689883.1 MSHA biogenesis protein MshQ [Vibrio metschnikovii]EKO3779440.1 MSHA biogenesis protein MshQ [Vibrio metschnikovii]EKO3781980.1 MSHA biogenesis protein MshQ [Vibrio metschnikovii]
MSRIVFALLVLLASFSSVARDYLLFSGATSADLPTCSSNNWQQSVSDGIRTYHCANGSVSLSPGDSITATSQAILSADAGFSFAGSNIIGSSTTVVDLVSSYGATSWQGSNNHLFGSYQATNTPVTFNNVNVQGSITTGGAIDVQGGSVGGDVRSSNHGITLENTSVQGAVFANGNIIIDNSSVSGSIETPNNSLTVTDSTITGSLTANGNIMVTRANVSGNITTPNNAITVLDSDIVGSLTANGDIKVTNSELKGDVTTSNNGIVITETNVVGDLSANGNIITDNSFVTGDITSTNNQVTLNNKSYILGNVTAGRPDWGTVNVNGGSTVTGVCQYRTVPDNACGITPALKCFNDNFNQSDLTQNWVTFKSSGDFTPKIVGNRLRLTEAVREQATAVTYQRIFPAAGNIVQVEFEHYAWANMLGVGGDGMAIIFSDASVTPKTGGYGGSLGYAPLIEMSVPVNKPGFAGGWLGIGIDEYGNFSNFNEGRNGGVGFRSQSVAVRGSQASNYLYLAGTQANLSPPIDVRAYCTRNFLGRCTQTAFDGEGPKHKYLITIDSRNPSNVTLKVERKYNSILEPETLIYREHLTAINNMETPEDLFLSITASTGGSVNHHEIDNFRVCALKSREVGEQVDHFRFTLPASNGLTCDAADVQIRACANSNCSELYQKPVSVNLTPNASPSASGGWEGGKQINFANGIANLKLRRNTPGSVIVGVQSSTPSRKPYTTNLCSRGGGAYSAQNCSLVFSDSGFIIDVPHAYANQLVTGTITALSKGDNPEQCIPSFGDVSKEVALWSKYNTPSGGPGFLAMNVVVNGSPISNNREALKYHSLYFDQNGQAEFQLTYREAGSLAFHARFNGSGDEQDLLLEGKANFIRVPKALIVRAENYDGKDELCDNDHINCPIFARAGEDFKLTISPIAYSSNNDHLPISNFEYQGLELTNNVVAPAKIELGGRDGQLNNPSYDHLLGDTTTIWRNINEVGVFEFSMKPPTDYWLTEASEASEPSSINLVEEGLEIDVVPSGPIGRFIPAYFDVSPMTVTLAAACNSDENSFTYLGQPFGYANNPGLYLRPKSGSGSDTLNYLIGDWWRYDNDWENREYINNINSLTVEKVSLNANVIRQPSLGSGVILNDEQLRYQKPIDPMVPFNADFNLQLSINDLRDSDDVCYRTSYSEDCLGYTFENIDQTMPLYWGRLTIEDVFGPETQGLEQPIYVERYTSNGFVRTTEDNCTALPAITGFILQSDDYVVVTEGSAVPPQVLAEHTAGNFAQGKRIVRFSAPGAGVRGVIDTMLNLNTHNLMWLAEPDDEKTLEDQPWQYYFKDSTQGQVQFGLYRGNDRVIWWRETN